METVEVMIYFGVAVLIGILVSGFLFDWNYGAMYDAIRKSMTGDDSDFKTIDKDGLYAEVYDFHQDCLKRTDNITKSVYIEESGLFTKEDLFSQYKTIGWCNSIQSQENDCGTREDIIMDDITLPKVIVLTCVDNTATRVE